MAKVKDSNYLTIQGWMNRIGCSSAAERDAYAIVYGFSQDGDSEFNGSYQYISEWLQSSKRTAMNVMASLEEKGLIEKRQIHINGVTFNRFVAIVPDFITSEKFSPGSEKSSPNNNNKDNNTTTLKENTLKENEPSLFGESVSVLPVSPVYPKTSVEYVSHGKIVEEVVDVCFDTFWRFYGKKVGKKNAEKAWKKVSLENQIKIIKTVLRYVASKPDVKYRPDPSTYLNGEKWEDEIIENNGNSIGQKGNSIINTNVEAINAGADAFSSYFNG